MQFGESPPGFGEGAEIGDGVDGGDARELLGEVVGVAAAVAGESAGGRRCLIEPPLES
uniref:Uncharacterized protein n=1 Tax=Candidatus Kentrum sp. TC TaxID=2126339 RepID=A0A450ZFN8_9GAMM|nr:MAG: hypothetical protein BECKTC1821D_GA0114238_11955 [Candidatus Kentron sp. TC]